MLVGQVTPRTREIVISRHLEIGYGFVAGSEKPVLIRSVVEGGPSAGKLHANDQILKINDEDVSDLAQADVIFRITKYNQELRLQVIANDDVQDVKNQRHRKSSIISRTTREKRRKNPLSVHFAETHVVIPPVESSPSYPTKRPSLLPHNVLKIVLENGQTRSFLCNSSTTIQDVSLYLGEKIGLKRLDHFSLVLQSSQSLNDSYIQQNERPSQIYSRRQCSSANWLCKFHLVLAPKDINFLLKEDPMAFEYFYKQLCSQVVEGRFRWELKYETAIELAALHIQQYVIEGKVEMSGQISVKFIEKEVGNLETFVPKAFINTKQKKDLQRDLTKQINQIRNLRPRGQKHISSLQVKLQYLKIVSEMKMYGGKQFNAIILDSTENPMCLQDKKLTSVIFVGSNVGLAQVTNPRSFSLNQIAAFNQISGLVVAPHTEGKQNVKLFLTNGKSVTLILGPIYETKDLVYLISGYCKYLVENGKSLSIIDTTGTESVDTGDEEPPYAKRRGVLPDKWNHKTNDKHKNEEDSKDINFVPKPKCDESKHHSIITSCGEDSEPRSEHHVSNGKVKISLKIQENNNNIVEIGLGRIVKSSPQTKNVGALKDFGQVFDNVDGHRKGKKARIRLSDHLGSESTDEEEKIPETKTVKTDKNALKDDIPVVIGDGYPDSVCYDSTNRDGEPLQDDDPVTNPASVESTEIDIRKSGDSIPSHQASGDISRTSSSVSPDASKDSGTSIPLSTNDVSAPLSDLRLNVDQDRINLQSDRINKSKAATKGRNTGVHSKNNDKVGVNKEDSPCTVTAIGNGINISPENTTRNINCHIKDIDDITDDLNKKRNSYDANSHRFMRRRRSSGYIPPLTMNVFTPECVILDGTIPKTQGPPSNEKEAEIMSRSKACDDTLKILYSLKTKLSTLLHSKRSVRTSKEILRANKQLMVDKITVLVECIKQIQKLPSTEEKEIVKAVLRSSSAFDLLTESCSLLYNAQYSMRRLTTELDNSIDKHIDVLVSTDAWDSTTISDMTVELHKDKCDLVHQVLNSLRKIINTL